MDACQKAPHHSAVSSKQQWYGSERHKPQDSRETTLEVREVIIIECREALWMEQTNRIDNRLFLSGDATAEQWPCHGQSSKSAVRLLIMCLRLMMHSSCRKQGPVREVFWKPEAEGSQHSGGDGEWWGQAEWSLSVWKLGPDNRFWDHFHGSLFVFKHCC